MHWMHQVRAFAQQAISLADRIANQIQFTMLQVTQAAVDDACGTAGDARSEVILLDQ